MKKKKGDVRGHVRRILLRVPVDLAEWIDDTAARANLSRDAFLRLQLQGIRRGFKLAESDPSSEEGVLFKRFEDRMIQATERAMEEAVRTTILNAGGVARGVGRRRR